MKCGKSCKCAGCKKKSKAPKKGVKAPAKAPRKRGY